MLKLVVCVLLPLAIVGQCPPNAVLDTTSSSCLQFYRSPVNFDTAETICASQSGHLVSVHNAIDNSFIASNANRFFSNKAWLGAKANAADVTNPLNWYWTDGSKYDYTHYKVGEPKSQGRTSCLQLEIGTSSWSTNACNHTLPFICAYPQIVPPTCPTPVIPSHCPNGYTWFRETDFCYKNTVKFTNFNDARSACQADGGELASIHSQAENDLLVEFSKAGITNKDKRWNDQVWIGLIYQDQKWIWTDGTAVNYVNWGDGEPNNMDKEWWTVLVSDPHESKNSEYSRWNNIAQIDERAFLCKIRPLH
ncbi:unnamed protein product [Caenorhabditis bovis]|uniref:C-type lectin domain-containing protein n=1 Tax=Caenorhabditis bovis TaxID=2654633 RepID=A0A8S1EQH8_9PELO|nr:unnamed protein product [Caenorhabditis bovis]